jgi:hypothetical protein
MTQSLSGKSVNPFIKEKFGVISTTQPLPPRQILRELLRVPMLQESIGKGGDECQNQAKKPIQTDE